MQPRSLDQILGELQSSYNPHIDNLRRQQSLVPQSVDADIQEAQGRQTQAYDDILSGARRRGMGFSGIPLGEQAKYSSTVFAPEVLRARTAGQQRALSLEDAILGLNRDMRTQGQSMYENERNFFEQRRQFDVSAAAQRAAQAAAERAAFNPMGAQPTQGAQMPGANKTTSGQSLESFLREQYTKQPNAPRALQDQWAIQWAKANNMDVNNKQLWTEYNNIMPWDQFNDNAKRGAWMPKMPQVSGATAGRVAGSVLQPIGGTLGAGAGAIGGFLQRRF